MNNIVRIALYIVLITLLYLGVTTMMQSCGSSDPTADIRDAVENVGDKVNVDEYFEDDEFEDGETIDLSEDDSFDTEGSRTDYSALDDATDEFEASDRRTYVPDKDVTPVYSSPASSSGRHMVIAGNFLQSTNADKMVRKLSNMGYSAEKVVFNNSQYHSVLAVRSNDYSRVANVSSELKRSGVDNYIKTQK